LAQLLPELQQQISELCLLTSAAVQQLAAASQNIKKMLLCCHDVLRLDCSGLSAGTALKFVAVFPSVAVQSDTAADSVHIRHYIFVCNVFCPYQ